MSKPASGLSKLIGVLVQSVGIQALGTVFFYILSVYLSTNAFGQLSWATALSLFLTTIIGFGLEQVVLRRVAAGNETSNWAAIAFLLHSAIGSIIMLGLLFLVSRLAGSAHPAISILPIVFCVQAMAMLVVPFKLLLNAKANYLPYAIIALISYSGRIAAVIVYVYTGNVLDIYSVSIIMLAFATGEMLATAIYIWITHSGLSLQIPLRGYRKLLKEASPQYLSVLFDISLARADWILLGILSTYEATGLYSFAYRAFELLRIPTAAVGLLLMPKIAPLLQRTETLKQAQVDKVNHFFRIEMWVVCGMMLVMNALWVPLVSAVTHGRYGANNMFEAGLLSLCLPLHFAINLMWILAFSARKYARIARITLISSVVNIGSNVVLIPLLGGRGAGISFLAASLIQASLYYMLLRKSGTRLNINALVISYLVAFACIAVPHLAGINTSRSLLLAIPLLAYAGITLLLRQWRLSDLSFIKQMLAR